MYTIPDSVSYAQKADVSIIYTQCRCQYHIHTMPMSVSYTHNADVSIIYTQCRCHYHIRTMPMSVPYTHMPESASHNVSQHHTHTMPDAASYGTSQYHLQTKQEWTSHTDKARVNITYRQCRTQLRIHTMLKLSSFTRLKQTGGDS